jgi:hypothetical protein
MNEPAIRAVGLTRRLGSVRALREPNLGIAVAATVAPSAVLPAVAWAAFHRRDLR